MEHARVYETLVNRAKGFLHLAELALSHRLYDLACFMAERAVQLYLKAQLFRLAGDYPRTHHIRQLLARLLEILPDAEACILGEYVRANRARLSELEDAYVMARYTTKPYTREDAEEIICFVREILERISKVVERAR